MLGLWPRSFYACLTDIGCTYVWLDQGFDLRPSPATPSPGRSSRLGMLAFGFMIPWPGLDLDQRRHPAARQALGDDPPAGSTRSRCPRRLHFWLEVKADLTRPLLFAGAIAGCCSTASGTGIHSHRSEVSVDCRMDLAVGKGRHRHRRQSRHRPAIAVALAAEAARARSARAASPAGRRRAALERRKGPHLRVAPT